MKIDDEEASTSGAACLKIFHHVCYGESPGVEETSLIYHLSFTWNNKDPLRLLTPHAGQTVQLHVDTKTAPTPSAAGNTSCQTSQLSCPCLYTVLDLVL